MNHNTRVQRELEATTRIVVAADEAHLRAVPEDPRAPGREPVRRRRLAALLGWT